MVLHVVNDNGIDVDEITLKYLVSGHTYMSSDSAHGWIEKEMRSMKTVAYMTLETFGIVW